MCLAGVKLLTTYSLKKLEYPQYPCDFAQVPGVPWPSLRTTILGEKHPHSAPWAGPPVMRIGCFPLARLFPLLLGSIQLGRQAEKTPSDPKPVPGRALAPLLDGLRFIMLLSQSH